MGLGQSEVGSSLPGIQCPHFSDGLWNSPRVIKIKCSGESETLNMGGAQSMAGPGHSSAFGCPDSELGMTSLMAGTTILHFLPCEPWCSEMVIF